MATQLKICKGSDCRRYAKKLWKLGDGLPASVSVRSVKCLDICKGPVVLVHRDGKKYCFKKLRGKSLRSALASFLLGEDMDERLRTQHVKRK